MSASPQYSTPAMANITSAPFRPIPPLLRLFQGFVIDKWKSADRLATVVGLTRTRLRLTLIHAKNDLEIPCSESDAIFRTVSDALIGSQLDDDEFATWKKAKTIVKDDGTFIAVAKGPHDVEIREELTPYGGNLSMSFFQRLVLTTIGHNNVIATSAVALAVMRSFGLHAGEDAP